MAIWQDMWLCYTAKNPRVGFFEEIIILSSMISQCKQNDVHLYYR
jgi:hypothetical protein